MRLFLSSEKKADALKNAVAKIIAGILIFVILNLFRDLFPSPVSAATSSLFTLSLWVNPSTSVTSKALIGKAEEMRLFTDASGYVGCQIKATSWQTAAQATTQALTVGSWSHVVCTYDKVNLTVYVNGTPTVQTSLTSQTDDTAAALKIGQDDSASTPYGNLAGIVDEFKFYNYALTSDEVKTEYNRGSAIVLGALGTDPSNPLNPLNSQTAAYCIPGDSASCNPPVLEWKLEEGAGGNANDTSGNGNAGTATGTTVVSGKIGKARKFTASDTISATITNPGNTNTVEVWIYPTGSVASKTIITNLTTDGSSQPVYGSCTGTAISLNQWTHLVAVSSGASVCRIYQNGVLTAVSTTGVSFGTTFAAGVTSFTGTLDEVRIYSYARTPAQIAWDYNRGAPLAHWKFDECQGTTLNDSSGNSYTGTWQGGTSVGTCATSASTAWYNGRNGKYNSSLSFASGSSDYLSVSDNANLRFDANTQDFSVFAWVKRAATGANHYILSKEDADNDGWRMLITSGNVITCSVNSTDFSSTSTIDTNWHLVGCVVDRDGNGQVYVDGKADGTAVAISSATMATTSELDIGTNSYATRTNFMNGQIDDVKIFNYALTSAQIKTLYNQGAAVRFAPISGTP